MKKPFLYLHYSLAVAAALVLMTGSYFAMRTWLPMASRGLFVESFIVDGERENSFPLHEAAESGDLETLKGLLANKPDVNARDDYYYTPLMTAAEYGQAGAVKLLLEAGADVHLTDKDPAPDYDPVAVMEEVDPKFRLKDEASKEEFREMMKNTPGNTAMNKASTGAVVHLLVEAGGDIAEISDETRALMLGLVITGYIDCTLPQFQSGRAPRFGRVNPEKMNVPFWNAMTRSGAIASDARDLFDPNEKAAAGAVWCNQRFGKSMTFLPDGRIIEIGGEHEDFYDRDFHIYNDVFVHHGNSQFEIYGYPESVFPPTDFHTATLVGNHIYIIGGLGYPQDRKPGTTPVYRLSTKTLAMEKVKTTGQNPGWIQRHRANFKAVAGKPGEIHLEGGHVCMAKAGRDEEDWIENEATFVLDLESLKWKKGNR